MKSDKDCYVFAKFHFHFLLVDIWTIFPSFPWSQMGSFHGVWAKEYERKWCTVLSELALDQSSMRFSRPSFFSHLSPKAPLLVSHWRERSLCLPRFLSTSITPFLPTYTELGCEWAVNMYYLSQWNFRFLFITTATQPWLIEYS